MSWSRRFDCRRSSANFTEAAQERNIEIGLLVVTPLVTERTERIERHFRRLSETKYLQELPTSGNRDAGAEPST
ncbi:MAG: hypothetical protein OXU81_10850 [Gammaproteobacteria bacterium]|nr:hypothetical protein [Gammaproteobacteria bacterium]